MQNNEIRRRITKIATFFDRFLAFIFCILIVFAFADVKGGVLTARGNAIHRGRTSCIVEVKITDDRGKLAFAGTFEFACIGG
jgi:hypothetical protein